MLCPRCGAPVGETATLCERCAAHAPAPKKKPNAPQAATSLRAHTTTIRRNTIEPAGFWLRFFALITDSVLISAIELGVMILLTKFWELSFPLEELVRSAEPDMGLAGAYVTELIALAGTVVFWISLS